MSEAHDAVTGTAGTPPGPVEVDALTGLVGWLAGADGTDRSDADLISGLDALERVKSACAAAQARLTASFVASQAAQARRLQDQARACSDAGDYAGWVAARDAALAKTLPPGTTRTSPDPTRRGGTRRGGTSGPGRPGRGGPGRRR